VPDRLAVPSQPGRAVRQVAEPLLVADRQAQVRARVEAVLALAALRREERHGVVADGQVAHAAADRLHDPGAFVAEHGRRVARRIGARRRVEVGVADAAGDEPDEHLARARLGQVELLHLERLAEPLQHGCAHLHARDPTAARCTTKNRSPGSA
jgi:hypothetical protein